MLVEPLLRQPDGFGSRRPGVRISPPRLRSPANAIVAATGNRGPEPSAPQRCTWLQRIVWARSPSPSYGPSRLDLTANQLKLSPELSEAVERARAAAMGSGELVVARYAVLTVPLSSEAKAALDDWVSSGDYEVSELTADDPDLATR